MIKVLKSKCDHFKRFNLTILKGSDLLYPLQFLEFKNCAFDIFCYFDGLLIYILVVSHIARRTVGTDYILVLLVFKKGQLEKMRIGWNYCFFYSSTFQEEAYSKMKWEDRNKQSLCLFCCHSLLTLIKIQPVTVIFEKICLQTK